MASFYIQPKTNIFLRFHIYSFTFENPFYLLFFSVHDTISKIPVLSLNLFFYLYFSSLFLVSLSFLTPFLSLLCFLLYIHFLFFLLPHCLISVPAVLYSLSFSIYTFFFSFFRLIHLLFITFYLFLH